MNVVVLRRLVFSARSSSSDQLCICLLLDSSMLILVPNASLRLQYPTTVHDIPFFKALSHLALLIIIIMINFLLFFCLPTRVLTPWTDDFSTSTSLPPVRDAIHAPHSLFACLFVFFLFSILHLIILSVDSRCLVRPTLHDPYVSRHFPVCILRHPSTYLYACSTLSPLPCLYL